MGREQMKREQNQLKTSSVDDDDAFAVSQKCQSVKVLKPSITGEGSKKRKKQVETSSDDDDDDEEAAASTSNGVRKKKKKNNNGLLQESQLMEDESDSD